MRGQLLLLSPPKDYYYVFTSRDTWDGNLAGYDEACKKCNTGGDAAWPKATWAGEAGTCATDGLTEAACLNMVPCVWNDGACSYMDTTFKAFLSDKNGDAITRVTDIGHDDAPWVKHKPRGTRIVHR